MKNLIKTEWLKMKNYRAFWWLIGMTALSYPGVSYISYNAFKNFSQTKGGANMVIQMLIGNPFSFPEIWHTIAYLSSFFVFIPGVIVIMFVTNEYTFKTNRQNIIDGWSRQQFMTSKLIDVIIISLIVTLLLTLISLIIGYINTSDVGGNIFSKMYYIGLFALQTFSQLSLAFMVGFLVRKAFISLGIFIFYFLILEPIAVKFAEHKLFDLGRFLPFEISNRLIPVPDFIAKFNKDANVNNFSYIGIHILLTILLTTLVWYLCFQINSKRDL